MVKTATGIKFLAIISASLAEIQTLFNLHKDADMHLSVEDGYTNIYHRAGMLLAEYQNAILTPAEFIKEFKILQQEYLRANNNFKSSILSSKDYKFARESIEKRN